MPEMDTSAAQNHTTEQPPAAEAFHPAGDSSFRFMDEMRCVLQSRLRVVAWIMLAGHVGFLIRNLVIGTENGDPLTTWFHVATCVLVALPLLPLNRQCSHSLLRLRLMEGLVFGVPALFFSWLQFQSVCECDRAAYIRFAASYPAQVSIMWMILVQLYALYVPVASRCTTSIIVVLSAIPLVTSIPAAMHNEELRQVLFTDRNFSAMVLWMAISAAIAIYRTHRFGQLQRDAFDARRLGSYTLREKIGSGGMGEVYRAEHALLKRPAAIKLIRPDKAGEIGALARFEEEVQSAASLTHPNTIEIYDYGRTEDGTFYYVMEFLPGLSLQDLVDRFGPLPPERAVHVLRQIASALREAHRRGLVHRDVKPSNVFVTERGGLRDVAKLLDFGLVKSASAEESDVKLTMVGAVVGSPLYAAPETTTDHRFDARSDVYSLGSTAFHILTGRPVFEGTNAIKLLFAHAHDDPPTLREVDPTLPGDLEEVVDRCLRKDPTERFQSINEFLAALDDCDLPEWTEQRAEEWWAEHDTTTVVASSHEPQEETLVVAAV